MGIRGGHAADSTSRKNGLPWQLIPVAMGGVAVVGVLVPIGVGKLATGGFGKSLKTAGVPAPATNRVAAAGVGLAAAPGSPGTDRAATVAVSSPSTGGSGIGGLGTLSGFGVGVQRGGTELAEEKDVYLSGIAVEGRRVHIYLSNGDSYTDLDRAVEFIDRQFVIIRGKVYRMPKAGRAVLQAAQPAVSPGLGVPAAQRFPIPGYRGIEFGKPPG